MRRSIPSMLLAFLALSFGIPSATLWAQTITEFRVINGPIGGLAAGADGNLWFTELGADKIGRMTVAGVVTEFAIATPGAFPLSIAAGPDGNLWFTESGRQFIGRITPDGVITEFPIPSNGVNGRAAFIAGGPDGNIWFTELSSIVGRITPDGSIVEFPIHYTQPAAITAGPDRQMWFTVQAGPESKICSVSPDGVTRQFGAYGELKDPAGIIAGPDGNLWFTQSGPKPIGRITVDGNITLFSTPPSSLGIAVGRDGNLWFLEAGRSIIARMTTNGDVTGEFPLPSVNSFSDVIVRGPDGQLWFTEQSGAIRRLSLDEPASRRRAVRR